MLERWLRAVVLVVAVLVQGCLLVGGVEGEFIAEPCPPGTDDCDGDGVCEDVTNNPDHCGVCGERCDGNCEAAICTLAELPGALTTSVAVSGEHIYLSDAVTNGGQVWQFGDHGSGLPVPFGWGAAPTGLHAEGPNLFYIAAGAKIRADGSWVPMAQFVRQLEHQPGEAAQIGRYSMVDMPDLFPTALTIGGKTALFAFQRGDESSRVFGVPRFDVMILGVDVVVPGVVTDLALHPDGLHGYVTVIGGDYGDGALVGVWPSFDPSVEVPQTLAALRRPVEVVEHSRHLYVLERGLRDGLADGRILRFDIHQVDPVQLEGPHVVCDGLADPHDMAFDGDRFYVLESGWQSDVPNTKTRVLRIDAETGAAAELATTDEPGQHFFAVTVNDTHVFFTEQSLVGLHLHRRAKRVPGRAVTLPVP